jgi:hypothetical protein
MNERGRGVMHLDFEEHVALREELAELRNAPTSLRDAFGVLETAITGWLEQPGSTVRGFRVYAARHALEQAAEQVAWRRVYWGVSKLREFQKLDLDEDVDADEPSTGSVPQRGVTFTEWARRHPNTKLTWPVVGVVSEDGDKLAITESVPLPRRQPVTVETVIGVDEFDTWKPPAPPAPDFWVLALTGQLDEEELINLAGTDPLAAVFAPNTTLEVLQEAGAAVAVDTVDGEVALVLPKKGTYTAGYVDLAGDIPAQINDLVPVAGVVETTVSIDLATGVVTVANQLQTDTVGVVEVRDGITAARQAATDLLVIKNFLSPIDKPTWVERDGTPVTVLSVDVIIDVS